MSSIPLSVGGMHGADSGRRPPAAMHGYPQVPWVLWSLFERSTLRMSELLDQRETGEPTVWSVSFFGCTDSIHGIGQHVIAGEVSFHVSFGRFVWAPIC